MTQPETAFDPQLNLIFENSRACVSEVLSATVLETDGLTAIGHELYARRREDLSNLPAVEQARLITEKVGKILPDTRLLTLLERSKTDGKQLNIKYGIDPTGADVHLGHVVPMLTLDRLLRMGHAVTFVVGDFTAKIGDPSGRVSSRPVLTDEQIKLNMANYGDQVRPLFDMDKVTVVNNGDWLNDYPLSKLMGLVSQIPVASLLQRSDFRKRLEDGSGITQAELLYPVVMALDSVILGTDIEIGGRDQFLNLQMCRTVMAINGQEPETIITTDILEGTSGSGEKMSKSLGNYVGLSDQANEIFGRIMSIPDSLLKQYFELLTELNPQEWTLLEARMQSKDVNPMDVKKMLAIDIVSILHSPEAGLEAQTKFEQRYSKKDYAAIDEALPVIDPSQGIMEQIMLARNESRSAIGRLLRGGGIQYVDSGGKKSKITDMEVIKTLGGGHIKVGRLVLRLGESKSNG